MERFAPLHVWALLLERYRTQFLFRLGAPRERPRFTALDIGSNAQRVERTYQDVRRDGADHYFALFPASGQLAMLHNDQAVRLAVGDVALVDAARPVTYSADNGDQWNTVSLSLPRQSLVSYLDSNRREVFTGAAERPPDACSSTLFGTPGMVRDQRSRQPIPTCSWRSMISSAHYLHRPSHCPVSRHADKLFARIRNIIKDGFARSELRS